MEDKTKGAWVIHHARKLQNYASPKGVDALTSAGKLGSLLAAIAESDESSLAMAKVTALCRANGINQLEQDSLLTRMTSLRLIDRDGAELKIIGVTSPSVLQHTARAFEGLSPTSSERAALALADIASEQPVSHLLVSERISDEYRLSVGETADLLSSSEDFGFVDSAGQGSDKLYFNGNLFRRESAAKVQRVLGSLSSEDQSKLKEIEDLLVARGCKEHGEIVRCLGQVLFDKVQSIGMYDVHGVQNEAGKTLFVTRPAAFGKFSNPLHDDALDMAKALVACLTYGMTKRAIEDGRIRMIGKLLGKLIRGGEVGGNAPAIGRDYQALEFKGVVRIRRAGTNFFMRLLKRDVGELALAVLTSGDASHEALQSLPASAVDKYLAPEDERVRTRERARKLSDAPRSERQMTTLLRSLREG